MQRPSLRFPRASPSGWMEPSNLSPCDQWQVGVSYPQTKERGQRANC